MRSDAQRIRQVISNLVDNAIKFSKGGEVFVTATAERRGGDQALLTVVVEDTGIGIAPDRQDAIFEPFSQANTSISRSFGGTGLGLAISKAIANAMGGDITVESRISQGTRFTATFLLEDISAVYAEIAEREAQATQGRSSQLGLRVLIADDIDSNLEVAEALLRDLGCEVVRAHNGREAVATSRSQRFDVILMDLHMPEMDGISAAQAIAKGPGGSGAGGAAGGRSTRIFAWTADVTATDSLRRSGVDWAGTLLKPTTIDSLSQALAQSMTKAA